ncbi:hypothetical protein STEG23_015516 [Scotinomys teguina]
MWQVDQDMNMKAKSSGKSMADGILAVRSNCWTNTMMLCTLPSAFTVINVIEAAALWFGAMPGKVSPHFKISFLKCDSARLSVGSVTVHNCVINTYLVYYVVNLTRQISASTSISHWMRASRRQGIQSVGHQSGQPRNPLGYHPLSTAASSLWAVGYSSINPMLPYYHSISGFFVLESSF